MNTKLQVGLEHATKKNFKEVRACSQIQCFFLSEGFPKAQLGSNLVARQYFHRQILILFAVVSYMAYKAMVVVEQWFRGICVK